MSNLEIFTHLLEKYSSRILERGDANMKMTYPGSLHN